MKTRKKTTVFAAVPASFSDFLICFLNDDMRKKNVVKHTIQVKLNKTIFYFKGKFSSEELIISYKYTTCNYEYVVYYRVTGYPGKFSRIPDTVFTQIEAGLK